VDQQEIEVDQQDIAVHGKVQCDICNTGPIRGTRFKCLTCINIGIDFDMCQSCEAKGDYKDTKHKVDHNLLVAKMPLSQPSLQRQSETPHILKCKSCNMAITGLRYKCTFCPDYNLCGKCDNNHRKHFLLVITTPQQEYPTKKMINLGQICDNCKRSPMNGSYYVCLECSYKICRDCKANNIHSEHTLKMVVWKNHRDTVISTDTNTNKSGSCGALNAESVNNVPVTNTSTLNPAEKQSSITKLGNPGEYSQEIEQIRYMGFDQPSNDMLIELLKKAHSDAHGFRHPLDWVIHKLLCNNL